VQYKDEDGALRKRMPMMDIFDMFAGTSTGSILSAGLAITKNDTKEREP
jgi:patatin-like phospholipase/acyl hydrolase